MNTLLPRPPKVEIDFTDAQLAGYGGWSVLGQMADRLDLPRALSSVSVKQRAGGASDAETLWSLIASLAAGNGALSDLRRALRGDRVGQRLLGLGHVPSGQRPGDYLARMDEGQVEALLAVARFLAGQVAPTVVEHEVAVCGYVPVFIGALWASGRLHPGLPGAGASSTATWVAPCLPEGTAVLLRADNACYRGELVAYCRERGWDYWASLTDRRKCAPVLDVIEGLPEEGWTDIGMGEDATLVCYRPAGWEEQSYVVVRRRISRARNLEHD